MVIEALRGTGDYISATTRRYRTLDVCRDRCRTRRMKFFVALCYDYALVERQPRKICGVRLRFSEQILTRLSSTIVSDYCQLFTVADVPVGTIQGLRNCRQSRMNEWK